MSSHDGSVKNAAVDPHCEYLATTGCDGALKVTKIAKNDSKLVQTHKISKKTVTPASNQWLGLAWSPSSGDYLYYGGDNQLGYLSRADSFSKKQVLPQISHGPKGDISLVRAVSEKCIVTAGLDKYVKVWHLPEGPGVPDKIKLVA